METFWFIALSFMLIMYVILDGFDLGAGIIHLLAAKSNQERRAILTRDIGILKRTEVTHGYFIRSDKVEKQTEEVVKRFDLQKSIKEFTRCLECNSELSKIEKVKIIQRLPPKVAASQNEFFICPVCQKLFWAGTHHQKMLSLVQKIKTMNFS